MASSLRDELASLKIERRGSRSGPGPGSERRRGSDGGGLGLRLLSMVLWLVPLSLVGAGGYYAYRQYREIRSPSPRSSVGLRSRR